MRDAVQCTQCSALMLSHAPGHTHHVQVRHGGLAKPRPPVLANQSALLNVSMGEGLADDTYKRSGHRSHAACRKVGHEGYATAGTGVRVACDIVPELVQHPSERCISSNFSKCPNASLQSLSIVSIVPFILQNASNTGTSAKVG